MILFLSTLLPSQFSEYINITDGNGSLVWYKYGYHSSAPTSYLEVGFGNADNITVQIYLRNSYSRFKLQYGIIKQGLFSGNNPFIVLTNLLILIGCNVILVLHNSVLGEPGRQPVETNYTCVASFCYQFDLKLLI